MLLHFHQINSLLLSYPIISSDSIHFNLSLPSFTSLSVFHSHHSSPSTIFPPLVIFRSSECFTLLICLSFLHFVSLLDALFFSVFPFLFLHFLFNELNSFNKFLLSLFSSSPVKPQRKVKLNK